MSTQYTGDRRQEVVAASIPRARYGWLQRKQRRNVVILSGAKDLLETIESRKMILRCAQDDSY